MGQLSGLVFSVGAMRDLRVGGDVIGGGGQESGVVGSQLSVGNMRIGGDVRGGNGLASGAVSSGGKMGNVRIGGDVLGGGGDRSGTLGGTNAVGHVLIGGDLIGGSIDGAASLDGSGRVVGGRLASVTIRGSFVAGADNSTGTLTLCGAIRATYDIGPIKVGGNIVGNENNAAMIWATGQPFKPTKGYDVAIASLSVKGSVSFAKLLGGFQWVFALDKFECTNADACIGKVRVGGDWVASSIVAGAMNYGADDAPGGMNQDEDNASFGNDHDLLQDVNDSSLIARIASINIKGQVKGTLNFLHFGFVSQQIGKLKIAGENILLAKGASNDSFAIPFSNNVGLSEV
jgi:hypothetical protein